MRELGHVEGSTWVLEARSAEGGDNQRLRDVAMEILRSPPDVFWAGHSEAALTVRRLSTTVPIVFNAQDPVKLGLVASFARPGGNATGIEFGDADLGAKRMEYLRDAFPKARLFAFLYSGDTASNRVQLEVAQKTAALMKIELLSITIPSPGALGAAFDEARRHGADGMFMNTSPMYRDLAPDIVALAMRHRIPVIYEDWAAVEAGGLMSYGPNRNAIARRTAVYVDRILKGAHPGDIPVERWDRFELVINLRTASALGFVIPPSLVALADRVIE
jgi:putative ABC transport system substrate-binding protein